MKKIALDKLSNSDIVAFVAAIIALLSLIVSVRSCQHTEKQFGVLDAQYALSTEEVLLVSFEPSFLNYDTLIIHDDLWVALPKYTSDDPDDKILTAMLITYWDITLANVGHKALSITDINALHQRDGVPSFHSYSFNGLYTHDLDPVPLPINMEPGTAISVRAKIGLYMEPNSTLLSKDIFFEKDSFPINELFDHLEKSKIDFLDNKLSGLFSIALRPPNIIKRIQPADPYRDTYVIIYVKTSSGKVFSEKSSWYEHLERHESANSLLQILNSGTPQSGVP